MNNTIKCRYCEYTTYRFKGKGNYGGKRLFKHILDNHEDEFLKSVGFAGSIGEYLDMCEEEYSAIQTSES